MVATVVVISKVLLCLINYSQGKGNTAQVVIEKTPVKVQFFQPYRPFEFAFQSNDGMGTTQHRMESGDGSGAVTGAYGYIDPYGIYRSVEYIADDNGFRAVVKTNEPGTANQDTADALWIVQPPPSTMQRTKIQGPPKKSLPAKTKPANYTPVASSSVETADTLSPKYQFQPVIVQYPYQVLSKGSPLVAVKVPASTPVSKSSRKQRKLTPRIDEFS